MLPKRKLIKKRHRHPEVNEKQEDSLPNTLVQRLKSNDCTVREQALTYIASLCSFNINHTEVAILAEMIGILYEGNNALIYQCLFALANLCEIEAKVTSRLFELGLDKALIKLNSADKDLLKPIMVLMIALHDSLPQQYQYLQRGVESSLTVAHFSSSSNQLVLEFLVRIQSVGLKEEIYQRLYEMFKNQQKLKIRSNCLNILLRHPTIRNRIHKQAIEFCDEIINDIDLNSEYKTNILDSKSQINKAKQMETDQMEQEVEELLPLSHANYETFNDAVEAVQILFQALLTIMEEGWQEDSLQQEDYGEEYNQPIDIQNEKVISEGNSQIRTSFINFLTAQPAGLIRNTLLCFMEGQNIVNLSLRLLSYLSSANRQAVCPIICRCFQNIIIVSPPAEVISEVFHVGLYMLLKCGLLGLQVRHLLLDLGQKIFELNDIYKESWICLLQLYSIHFNPQKGKVLQQQNLRIGLILKKLILNIPYLQLEEWRGQTIDTLFDIYSNEQFDHNFVSLGLMQLLEGIQQRAGLAKKKRFIRQVLADINRFLEYKKKMIKF